ncbi:MAG TPA: hypothetical protein VEY67_03515, partial [Candidatus Dormibacteraeota bacterium]|nr:hypothetical protein [Candidatus Dormibacteraeota bacterium]
GSALLYGVASMTTAAGGWDCKFLTEGVEQSGAGWRDETCVGLGGYVGVTAYIHAISPDYATSDGFLGSIARTP